MRRTVFGVGHEVLPQGPARGPGRARRAGPPPRRGCSVTRPGSRRRRKTVAALAHVAASTSATGRPMADGHGRADQRAPAPAVGLAPVGHGGQERRVGLDQQPVEGAEAPPPPGRRPAFLNVTIPLNDSHAPEVEAPPGLVGAAGEAVDDRPLRDAVGGEDVERVVPRVAGVDHQGQVVRSWPGRPGRRTPPAGPAGGECS